MANVNQGFPSPTTPIADQSGMLNNIWYRFFVNIWKRTGGNQTSILPDPGENGIVVRAAENETIAGQLSGDVTTSGISLATTISNDVITTAKIHNQAVTYAKVQNVSAHKILGNAGSSAAAPSEVSLPLDYSNGGTGINTIGTENQIPTVNAGATALNYLYSTDQNLTTSDPVSFSDVSASSGFHPGSIADTDAANNTIYFSTDSSKLAYKDSGGVVHDLY